MEPITCIATGDAFITRRFPRKGYQGLEELQAVIGHGSHELRDVELYPGGLILYSLGNFIFQTETVSRQPYEAYDNKRLPIHTKVGAYMDQRSKNGTAGYPTQENVWRSVMASWDMEDGRVTEVRLYPVSLGTGESRTRRGTPVLTRDEDTLRYLARLSQPFGTAIRVEDGVGYVDCM